MQTLTRSFIIAAGVMFLFVAAALVISNQTTPADLAPTNDPLFQVPIPRVFWWTGGIGVAVALVCLFAQKPLLPTILVALCALGFLACRVYVSATGISAGFAGYLSGLGDAFGIRGGTAEILLIGMSCFLLIGCWVALGLELKQKSRVGLRKTNR